MSLLEYILVHPYLSTVLWIHIVLLYYRKFVHFRVTVQSTQLYLGQQYFLKYISDESVKFVLPVSSQKLRS